MDIELFLFVSAKSIKAFVLTLASRTVPIRVF